MANVGLLVLTGWLLISPAYADPNGWCPFLERMRSTYGVDGKGAPYPQWKIRQGVKYYKKWCLTR